MQSSENADRTHEGHELDIKDTIESRWGGTKRDENIKGQER